MTTSPRGLRGLHAALMTPYTSDGEIDHGDLRRLVNFVIGQGVDGLYVGGSTGEALLHTQEERQRVFETVAEENNGRVVLMGQVGAMATRECQALANTCKALGYDAVSAIPPIYFSHSKANISRYYQDIVSAADGVPLVVYNVPAMSGVNFTLEDLASLLEIPGVIGVKQTAKDMYQMEQLHRLYPDLLLLNGYDEMLLAGMASGANGGIGSTYNIMGGRYLAMRQMFESGDMAGALDMQGRCNKVIDALIQPGVFPALKYVLYRMGIIQTPVCRDPLETLQGTSFTTLDAIAAELRQS
ncbi:N-acetylneuraminate lyase [Aureimonas fodinaquatilis]|uniref:N-acetylneuraminate lyase n=1 Tax=Aureimonas fodinaquatilis TaxID=2565783 RepID=A0A5B0DWG3_9HYPH|nr:N-acetylneuraminate lyase [Aureimonas fodinaquatilis]KAA0970151.1 N-acetylneuraminate lyase [Aureimonas fodinaquatilis]